MTHPFLSTFLFLSLLIGQTFIAVGQELLDVQVKVYDQKLDPLSDAEIIIEEKESFHINTNGIAFIKLPKSSLPPASIYIKNDKLEVESWNYSKGILEIIVRDKKYRQLRIRVIDHSTNASLPDITVHISSLDSSPFSTDKNGEISFVAPNDFELSGNNLITVDGYQLVEQNLNQSGGTLRIKEIALPVEEKPVEPISAQNSSESEKISPPQDNVLQNMALDDLDSITSLTVLFTLMKKLEYDQLDSLTRRKLDDKFLELVQFNILSSTISGPSLGLISDSSVLNDDILQIMERIQYEGEMINEFRSEFEDATDQINQKLTEGGKNLSFEERKQLIELIVNLRNLLNKNEELFFKNNDFYRQQVDAMLNQLANIYELEDLLVETEEKSREVKEQLVFITMILALIIGVTALLIFLVRTLRSQKDQLATANEEIKRINSNLENMVAEKTNSLELINHELDTFMYRSSHNLRRPLTSIRGLAQIADITLNGEAVKLFDKVKTTTEEMEKMLFKLTMMRYINQPSDFNFINFKEIAEEINQTFSSEIEQGAINYNFIIADGISFKSYPHVIKIILNNLLENAFFFVLFNDRKDPEVSVDVRVNDEGILHISIRDNGCGIHPDIQDRIWDMFFIGNASSKGNGLGLYITKKAIESLDGTITLKTVLGKYCEFDIQIPAKEPIDTNTFEVVSEFKNEGPQ